VDPERVPGDCLLLGGRELAAGPQELAELFALPVLGLQRHQETQLHAHDEILPDRLRARASDETRLPVSGAGAPLSYLRSRARCRRLACLLLAQCRRQAVEGG